MERKDRTGVLLLAVGLGIVLMALVFSAVGIGADPELAERKASVLLLVTGALTVTMTVIILPWYIATRRRKAARLAFAVREGFEFTAWPDGRWAADILAGTVVGGDESGRGFALLRGTRGGCYFQAIDHEARQGKGGDIQTVVCVPLAVPAPAAFAIVQRSWLWRADAAGMHKVDPQPAGIDSHQVVLADKGLAVLTFAPEFLSAVAVRKKMCVEVLEDRLLVYRIGERLTGDDYLEWIDIALGLIGKLG